MSADYGDNRPDLAAFWMPFTANRQYKDAPRLLVEASGMYYRTVDGDSVLDGTAGLWCCNLGQAREEITEAVAMASKQAEKDAKKSADKDDD
jgi:beta-alanine--pyruvate transaminase